MSDFVSIRPIKRKENMANLVAKQLIDLIVSGKFPAGERLPSEKELCEMFAVGRNTLREATRALNILGFIDIRVPEGMFVAQSPDNFYTRKMQLSSKYGYDNVEELTEARIAVECAIARLAAQKAGEAEKRKLYDICRIMQETVNHRERLAADAQFHMTIAEISTSWHLLPCRNEQMTVYDKMRNCMSPMRQNEETPAGELRQNVGTVFNYDILRKYILRTVRFA